ncbi:MAG: MlaD family protein [Pseudomonadota bacterium]
MSKRANPAVIGAFVVGAVVLMVIGIMVFGSGKWFAEVRRFVVYFDESVNGLSVGAPVKLYGVQIGKVTEIQVAIDPEHRKILNPVFIEIAPDKIAGKDAFLEDGSSEELLDKLIEKGLRLQLQLTSFVTGQLYLEAQFWPDTPVRLTERTKGIKELPSIPSNAKEVQNTISELISDLRSVPFRELFTENLQVVKNIERLTGSDESMAAVESLHQGMNDLREILERVNRASEPVTVNIRQTAAHASRLMYTLDEKTGPLMDDLRETVVSTKTAVQQLQSTLVSMESVVSQDSVIARDISGALEEMARAARSIRLLTDYLERHPESLISGKRAATRE